MPRGCSSHAEYIRRCGDVHFFTVVLKAVIKDAIDADRGKSMSIKYSPTKGAIRICDFRNTIYPEIRKKRPVVVISSVAPNLCIVVPCSTTPPNEQKPWHYLLEMKPPLPEPYAAPVVWVKCDLIMTVSFDRMSIPVIGKDEKGKRIYDNRTIPRKDFDEIANCIISAMFPWKNKLKALDF